MTDVRSKLAEKNLTLPVAAKPLAAYVPAVKTGNLVFTAGQLPFLNGELPETGKVGADLTLEEAKEMAELCALNALA
ncbi:MAG: RidA family protein, partial [Candidatus Nanopelagicaceae bacterium]